MLISLPHSFLIKCLNRLSRFQLDCLFLPAEFRTVHCILNTVFWWKCILQIFPAILWFIFFLLLMVSFTEQNFLILMKSKLFMLYGLCFWSHVKNFLDPRSWRYSLMFFLKDWMLHFIAGYMAHFESIHNFLYKMWYLCQFPIIS